MKYCHYLFVALGITSAAILASCQDEDFGYTADQIAYRTNFEKMYGSVKDIPTWDFSSYNLRQMGLAGGPSYAGTRGLASNYTGTVNTIGATAGDILKTSAPTGVTLTDGWYSVPSATLSWLNGSLPEGTEYTQGKSFVLGKPQNNFAIIPIYQGHAGMTWELHLVDKATNLDYTLWKKSQGIRYKIDYDDANIIDVAGKEVHVWGEYWIEDSKYENVQKRVPIGYIFKGYNESMGDLTISCNVPSGANFNGHIVDLYWDNSGNETTGEVDFKDGENALVFSGTQRYIIPAATAAKMKNVADHLYFDIWWNNAWNNGTNCRFGNYEKSSERAQFVIQAKEANKNGNNEGWLDLDGIYSNEVGHTVMRPHDVQAKPILINGEAIKGDMYLYLKITQQDKDNPGYAPMDACQRSDENMMVALPITGEGIPGNVGTTNEYMIIGCEDANNTGSSGTDNSDWDYNDIVFLLVGQGSLPKVKEVIAEKRYMIEDLGSTFDFDFNDIVVDVSQSATKNYLGQYIKEDGTVYSETEVSNGAHLKSTAVIRHLCGTIPFQIHIGGTHFEKLPGKVDCNPALDQAYSGKYEMTNVDWDPTTNNITVTVWPRKAGAEWDNAEEDYYLGLYPEESSTFGFPESGEFPYIIACNQDVNWMEENISIPRDWFHTWPQQYYDYNNITPPTPSNPGSNITVDKTDGVKEVASVEGTIFSISTISSSDEQNQYPYIKFNQTNKISKIYLKVPANSAFEGYLGGWDNSASAWRSQDAVKIVNTTSSVKCYEVTLTDEVKSVSNTESFKLDLAKVEGNCSFDSSSDKPKVEIYLKQ